jgi:hypothetical protein
LFGRDHVRPRCHAGLVEEHDQGSGPVADQRQERSPRPDDIFGKRNAEGFPMFCAPRRGYMQTFPHLTCAFSLACW